jgi:hypothetical protein
MKPGFTKLGLQYYFTAGEKEIRCWTVPRGRLAPQAAGAIHTDFERGFIKAEVVAYADFHDLCDGAKSMAPIKAAGKYRQEGGKYVVQDGDIIHFQFSEFENAKGTEERLISGCRCCAEQVEEGGGGGGMDDRETDDWWKMDRE